VTQPRYRIRPSAIFAELADGSGVVLDLRTKAYFTLNSTGVFLWKRLAERPAAARDVAEGLCAEFAVDILRAEQDVIDVLRKLDEEALVEQVLD
jgi:hypothetical protein